MCYNPRCMHDIEEVKAWSVCSCGLSGDAEEESKSLNAGRLEMLERGLSVFRQRPKNAELLELAGTWVEDPDAEKALEELRTVDEDLWK